MGKEVLARILADSRKYGDQTIYVADPEAISPETEVTLLPPDPTRKWQHEGETYWLEVELVSEVVEGLESQLGRPPSILERFQAADFYARNDAFIPLAELQTPDRRA